MERIAFSITTEEIDRLSSKPDSVLHSRLGNENVYADVFISFRPSEYIMHMGVLSKTLKTIKRLNCLIIKIWNTPSDKFVLDLSPLLNCGISENSQIDISQDFLKNTFLDPNCAIALGKYAHVRLDSICFSGNISGCERPPESIRSTQSRSLTLTEIPAMCDAIDAIRMITFYTSEKWIVFYCVDSHPGVGEKLPVFLPAIRNVNELHITASSTIDGRFDISFMLKCFMRALCNIETLKIIEYSHASYLEDENIAGIFAPARNLNLISIELYTSHPHCLSSLHVLGAICNLPIKRFCLRILNWIIDSIADGIIQFLAVKKATKPNIYITANIIGQSKRREKTESESFIKDYLNNTPTKLFDSRHGKFFNLIGESFAALRKTMDARTCSKILSISLNLPPEVISLMFNRWTLKKMEEAEEAEKKLIPRGKKRKLVN